MKRLFAILVTASVVSSAQAADLLQIYTSARDTDPDYLAAVADAKASEEVAAQATAELLPQLYISGGWQRSMPGRIESAFSNTEPSNSWNASLVLRQTIFNGVQIINHKAGPLRIGQAKIDAIKAEQDLIVRATEAYIAYLQARNSVSFAEAEINALNTQYEEVQQRYDVGLIPVTDLQETQARYDFASAALLSAENDFESAKDILAEIFGAEVNDLPDFNSGMQLPKPDPQDLNTWINAALENNLDRKRLLIEEKLAAANVKRQKAKFLPTVNAQAEYGISETDKFGDSNQFGGESIDRRIGVSVDIPLYTGGRNRSQLREANALEVKVKNTLESNKRSVQRSVRSNYRKVLTSIKQTGALKQAVNSSNIALNAIKAGYDAGTRTITDVISAERDVLRAQRDFANARYEYVRAMMRLLKDTGALSPDYVIALNSQLASGGLADKITE